MKVMIGKWYLAARRIFCMALRYPSGCDMPKLLWVRSLVFLPLW